jgi:predicted PhzF superfamily epimerase YddE/YHI9
VPRPITYVDVFTTTPYRGNPVAVVHDADGLTTEQMQGLAAWTNLSETTFLLSPTEPGADYRVRIFTPVAELPFAGHPTLGTCHAWLAAGGGPAGDPVVQQCGAGLIRIRRGTEPAALAAGLASSTRMPARPGFAVADRPRALPTRYRLAFAAPPLVRSGPVDEPQVVEVAAALGIDRAAIRGAEWVDNGPGWLGVLLGSAAEVLAVRPSFIDQDIGVVGPYPAGSATAFELRAFFPVNGSLVEDPVTGSLNASVAQWLLGTGRAEAPYVASQGTALGRAGRVHIDRDTDGTIWVGGGTIACIEGQISI